MTTGNLDTGWQPRGNRSFERIRRNWTGTNASPQEWRDGRLLWHYYSCQHLTEFDRYCEYRYGTGNWSELWTNNFTAVTLPDPWTPNDTNALINKLYGEVKGGSFNAAVFAAQLNETCDGIGSAALRLGKAWRQARKGRFAEASITLTGKARGPSKKVATNWLELQYGWLPLLGDVHDAVQLLANRLYSPRLPVIRVSARKKVEDIGEYSVFRFTRRTIHRERYLFQPTAELTTAQVLGLNNPAEVFWEKLPYSFVLDWFLPVGPWLEAMSAARTLQGKFLLTRVRTFETLNFTAAPGYQVRKTEGVRRRDYFISREVQTTLQPRLPSWKPFGEVASGLTRCLNALALLANLKR